MKRMPDLDFYKPVYNGRECTGSECWYREEVRVQLEQLVVRKNKEELPEGKKLDRESGASSDSNVSDAGDAPQYRPEEMPENVKEPPGRDDGAL